MTFKEFFIATSSSVLEQFTDSYGGFFAEEFDLIPLHLFEHFDDEEDAESEDDDTTHPTYKTITAGKMNPKTAKKYIPTLSPYESNPKLAKQVGEGKSFVGAVLHLEPYAGSGHQTCPFATAIYKIQVDSNDLDPITKDLILKSPGVEQDSNYITFHGLENRMKSVFVQKRDITKKPDPTSFAPLYDISQPEKTSTSCPTVLTITLPGANLHDWENGKDIQLKRSQILWTKLVGGCANACLHTAGNKLYASGKLKSRREKTLEYFSNPKEFSKNIVMDLFKLSHLALAENHTPVARMNATSDVDWENEKFPSDIKQTEDILDSARMHTKFYNSLRHLIGSSATSWSQLKKDLARYISGKSIIEIFPNIQFYDYTKNPARMHKFLTGAKNWLPNYHLTFSLAENNRKLAKKFLKQGGNVAAVFNVAKSGKFPTYWAGFKVIDADKHDYRFLDEPGCVSGLRAKGEAMYASTDFGFVIQPDDPDLDQSDPAVIAMHKNLEQRKKREEMGQVLPPGSKRQVMYKQD